jgi:hypothetical protein
MIVATMLIGGGACSIEPYKQEAKMLSHSLRGIAALVVLASVAIGTGGCIQIQVIDRTPSTIDSTPLEEEDEHNLAVLAVDFDPPLEYDEIVARKERGEGITLLVAVENTGATAEQSVSVEVELSKDNGDTLFLHKQEIIDAIAPGEIKLVHFEDTEIPFSYEYQLRVRVEPVRAETRLMDNEKTYDLLITQP